MEPKATPVRVVSRRRLFGTLGSLFVGLLIIGSFFYLQSRRAQNIVSGIIAAPAENLASANGRTNVVLLGIGGEGHAGSDLTDSIIFISLDLKNRTAVTVPIPRDVWVNSLAAKVNTAYHYGNEKRAGGGRDLVKSAVGEILGQPVHYAVVLDFQGFVRAVDTVGGIDVTVERTFDDYKYPIPGKETAEPESDRYEHLHFDAGKTHMDGATALKFVRSRHAEGDEGTDFARSRRQEIVMAAFRDRLLSAQTLFNAETLNTLRTSLSSSLDTDIGDKEYGSFLKLFLSLNSGSSVRSLSLEDQFINPKTTIPYAGQWVLVPTISFTELHSYVAAELAK